MIVCGKGEMSVKVAVEVKRCIFVGWKSNRGQVLANACRIYHYTHVNPIPLPCRGFLFRDFRSLISLSG